VEGGLGHVGPLMCRRILDRRDDRGRDRPTSFVCSRPASVPATRVDLNEFHIAGCESSVASNAPQMSVHRRANWLIVEIADDKPPEDKRADIERRPPNRGAIRIYETLSSGVSQRARDAVSGKRLARFHERSGLLGMSFDRDVAILPHREFGTYPDRESRKTPQVGRYSIFLHAGVDKDRRRAEGKQVGELLAGDSDAAGSGESVSDLDRRLCAHPRDSVDDGPIFEKRVVERHPPPNDRWKGIMTEDNPKALPCQSNSDCRRNLVTAKDDRVRAL
jgi:hypothetical protein